MLYLIYIVYFAFKKIRVTKSYLDRLASEVFELRIQLRLHQLQAIDSSNDAGTT